MCGCMGSCAKKCERFPCVEPSFSAALAPLVPQCAAPPLAQEALAVYNMPCQPPTLHAVLLWPATLETSCVCGDGITIWLQQVFIVAIRHVGVTQATQTYLPNCMSKYATSTCSCCNPCRPNTCCSTHVCNTCIALRVSAVCAHTMSVLCVVWVSMQGLCVQGKHANFKGVPCTSPPTHTLSSSNTYHQQHIPPSTHIPQHISPATHTFIQQHTYQQATLALRTRAHVPCYHDCQQAC